MTDIYTPHRDRRFEYIWEAMQFIERNQCCRGCRFSKIGDPDWDQMHALEYPMCADLEAVFIEEVPIPEVEDLGEDGILCTKYERNDAI